MGGRGAFAPPLALACPLPLGYSGISILHVNLFKRLYKPQFGEIWDFFLQKHNSPIVWSKYATE